MKHGSFEQNWDLWSEDRHSRPLTITLEKSLNTFEVEEMTPTLSTSQGFRKIQIRYGHAYALENTKLFANVHYY